MGADWVVATVAIVTLMLLAPGVWASNKFTSLHRFDGGGNQCEGPNKGGCRCRSTLVFDAAGNLYGTTMGGGSSGLGTVFKLTRKPDGKWKETVLHSFENDGKDGAEPFAGLTFDGAGKLYGTTAYGGAHGGFLCCGTVFELSPNRDGTWTETVLHSFVTNANDGSVPETGVIFDAKGNLYGTTVAGGPLGWGTVFELTPSGDGHWSEHIVYAFQGGDDGRQPDSGLIFDGAGNLYGTTSRGGASGVGAVFKLTPNEEGGVWTESVLHSFNGMDGSAPFAGVIFDAQGNLYGTTAQGGPHFWGTAFKLAPTASGSWKESVLHGFNFNDGAGPSASLIFDSVGNLYGTTSFGGRTRQGTVFKLTPTSNGQWLKVEVHSFRNHPGSFPYSGLVFDGDGNLYGTTNGDLFHTVGSVFEITP
jgi:uncharacterized repeat protein (TIGR03803 family)